MEFRMDAMGSRVRFLAAACLAALWVGAGCSSMGHKAAKPKPVVTSARNFVGDKRLDPSLRRVLLLPVCGGDAAQPESAAALDAGFATALERQMRFEVVTISREECRRRWGNDSLLSAAALPPGFLEEVGHDFAAQGVMFVDLTAYRPYRPITLGVRAKLALVDAGRLVWSFDEVFSAGDPAIIAGLKAYYAGGGGDRGESPANLPEAALLSPSRFGAYAAEATFETLPPR
ncbi:MAG: hypothetical protein ABSF76_11890 [Opitutaceae bacterium]|jgi:hypothetical protein